MMEKKNMTWCAVWDFTQKIIQNHPSTGKGKLEVQSKSIIEITQLATKLVLGSICITKATMWFGWQIRNKIIAQLKADEKSE